MPGGIPLPLVVNVPVGSVLPWLKTLTGTPALPPEFVECNGQTLNDSESVYNSQTIPNLNGDSRFLRGNSTSGGTGGAATVTLSTANLPAHSHTLTGGAVGSPGSTVGATTNIGTTFTSSSVGSGTAHENLPPYYNVVWIMRVK